MEKEYYGFLENVGGEGPYFLRFDLFSSADLEYLREFKSSLLNSEALDQIESSFAELTLELKDIDKLEALSSRKLYEGQWYKLILGEIGDYEVLRYSTSDTSEGRVSYLHDIEFVDGRTVFGKELNSLFSLDSVEDSDFETIVTLLDTVEKPRYVGVYNVGQGNCTALCDKDGIPLLYIDFGGGEGANKSTYPSNIKFCFLKKPTVLLSHWDRDHWVSKNFEPKSLNSKWIVPRQKLGLSHLKLAKDLYIRGNLVVYPDNIQSIISDIGILIKNTGTDRNSSGLTFISSIKSRNGPYITLFPGDSKYKSIPGVYHFKYDGLIATHHGGHYKNNLSPKSNIFSQIAYSYGTNNTHRHPSKITIGQNKHWRDSFSTFRGHISLNNWCGFPLQNCSCGCNLIFAQW